MEDEMTRISNEGLAIEIKNLSLQMADLKAILAQQQNNYIHKEVFELRMKEQETKLRQLDLKIIEVRRETSKANWRTHTLTAVFTAVLVLLTNYFVASVIGR